MSVSRAVSGGVVALLLGSVECFQPLRIIDIKESLHKPSPVPEEASQLAQDPEPVGANLRRASGAGVASAATATAESAAEATSAASATAARSSTSAALSMALGSLWEGVDFRNESYSFKFLAPKSSASDAKQIQIFGLQHTGMNLLNALLYINFGKAAKHIAMDEPDAETATTGLWRHANIKEVYGADRGASARRLDDAHVFSIVLIRDPLPWVELVRRYPYELLGCVGGPDWLTRKCQHQNPTGNSSLVQGKEYTSLVGVWNQWNDGYVHSENFGFPRKRVIKYEDLVGNPDAVLDGVSKFLGLEKPVAGWKGLSEAEDANAGRLKAFENIHTKPYKDELSLQEQRAICSQVSKPLTAQFGYDKNCAELMHQGL